MKTIVNLYIYIYVYTFYYGIKLGKPFRVNSYWHIIGSELQIPEKDYIGT